MTVPPTEKIYDNHLGGVVLYAKSTVDQSLVAVRIDPVTGAIKVDTELTAAIDPTGLATAANQATANQSLASMAVTGFSQSDSLTRPANATPYVANKSMNCSVAVTAMAYTLKRVTLTAANAFAVGDRITVAGVNTGFTVANIDGNWVCVAGTNATTVVFDVLVQPTGTTPQTISVGTIAKCLSMEVAALNGGTVILSRFTVSLPGVAMTGSLRAYIYAVQPTVLVDQATFTLLAANDANRREVIELYPVTEGSGSDCTFASKTMWEVIKCAPGDKRIYISLVSGVGTPASAGVITTRAAGLQMAV